MNTSITTKNENSKITSKELAISLENTRDIINATKEDIKDKQPNIHDDHVNEVIKKILSYANVLDANVSDENVLNIVNITDQDLSNLKNVNINIANINALPPNILNVILKLNKNIIDFTTKKFDSNELFDMTEKINDIFNKLSDVDTSIIHNKLEEYVNITENIQTQIKNKNLYNQNIEMISNHLDEINNNEYTQHTQTSFGKLFNINTYLTTTLQYRISYYILNFTCILIIFLSLFARFMIDVKLDNASIIITFTLFIILGLILYYNVLQNKILDIYDYDNKEYIIEEHSISKNFWNYSKKLVLSILIALLIFKEFYVILYTLHMIVNTIVFTFVSILNIIYAWIRLIIDEIILTPKKIWDTNNNISNILFPTEKVDGSTLKGLIIFDNPIIYNIVASLLVVLSSIFGTIVSLPFFAGSTIIKVIKFTIIYFLLIISLLILGLFNIIKRISLIVCLTLISIFKNPNELFNINNKINLANTEIDVEILKRIDLSSLENDLITLNINYMKYNDIKTISKGIEYMVLMVNLNNKSNENFFNALLPSKYLKIKEIQNNITNPLENSLTTYEEYLIKFIEQLKENYEFPELFTLSYKNKNFNALLYASEIIEYLNNYKNQQIFNF